jgi:hypothetical protein
MSVEARIHCLARGPRRTEPRRYRRFSAPPVLVRNADAVVVNISEGGVCLELPHPPDTRGAYYLTLTDGLFYLGHDLRAEVRWTRGNRVGMEWTNLSDEARLFLRRCFQRWTEEQLPIWVELYAS